MKNYNLIVIGGSAAGVSAALTARKFYPNISILLIRNMKSIPIPCGIPYVFGTIGDPMKNLIPVDAMMEKNNVEVLIASVTKINSEFKIVFVNSNMKDGFTYDRLILATGSTPLIPNITGINKNNIFSVQKTPENHLLIMDQLDKSENLVIVGGGFIGAEFAEECKKRKPALSISIIEMQEHCLQLVYDPEFCVIAEKSLVDQKINLLTNERVVSFKGSKNVASVKLESGKEVPADMVILSIGCSANVGLASDAGLRMGPTNGIYVDEYMTTSNEFIFACGDCAEKKSFFDGQPTNMKLASIATMEARIAGANVFSNNRKNIGVVGCFSTVLNNQAFSCAGLTETQALEQGYQIAVGEAESVNRHPGSMPGSAMMKVKLIFDLKSQKILGGQIVGALSGGELINAISVMIGKKMVAEDIATFQASTHPALTASPIAYQLVNAAENALVKIRNSF